MGDKEVVYRVVDIVKSALKKYGFSLTIREYEVYKDKHTRTRVDKTKTRIYITIR